MHGPSLAWNLNRPLNPGAVVLGSIQASGRPSQTWGLKVLPMQDQWRQSLAMPTEGGLGVGV